MKKLPIIKLGKKTYFVDERLGEIRNIKNPHDAESVSPELIAFWKKKKWFVKKKKATLSKFDIMKKEKELGTVL